MKYKQQLSNEKRNSKHFLFIIIMVAFDDDLRFLFLSFVFLFFFFFRIRNFFSNIRSVASNYIYIFVFQHSSPSFN